MAKEPDKPRARTILTGAARPVEDAVERAQGILKDRPGPSRPPSQERKAVRKRPPEIEEEPPPDPEDEAEVPERADQPEN
jgi:hypothetical protein